MKADAESIRRLVHGAVRVIEAEGKFRFHRYSAAQDAVYNGNSRTVATSGIRLEFETDASAFTLRGTLRPGSSRFFADFDIVVNGIFCRHESIDDLRKQGEYFFEVPLPEGRLNRVTVYFPCVVAADVSELSFAGGTVVRPVKRKRTLLCFGDSITHGYDARFPSLSYPNQLADALDSEMFNKAFGGDIFNPPLVAVDDDPVRPDLITVAYGTNDWSHSQRAEMTEHARGFLALLAKKYPGIPVYVLQPIWRRDHGRVTAVGTFAEAAEIIREAAKVHPRSTVVSGLDLVPHLDCCYSPDGLHPNDFGFQFMAKNLLRKLSAAGVK